MMPVSPVDNSENAATRQFTLNRASNMDQEVDKDEPLVDVLSSEDGLSMASPINTSDSVPQNLSSNSNDEGTNIAGAGRTSVSFAQTSSSLKASVSFKQQQQSSIGSKNHHTLLLGKTLGSKLHNVTNRFLVDSKLAMAKRADTISLGGSSVLPQQPSPLPTTLFNVAGQASTTGTPVDHFAHQTHHPLAFSSYPSSCAPAQPPPTSLHALFNDDEMQSKKEGILSGGQLVFPNDTKFGSACSRPYIYVMPDVDVNNVVEVLIKEWAMSLPRIVLFMLTNLEEIPSYNVNQRQMNAFKKGLMKVSECFQWERLLILVLLSSHRLPTPPTCG